MTRIGPVARAFATTTIADVSIPTSHEKLHQMKNKKLVQKWYRKSPLL
jgi:hypothetical protein